VLARSASIAGAASEAAPDTVPTWSVVAETAAGAAEAGAGAPASVAAVTPAVAVPGIAGATLDLGPTYEGAWGDDYPSELSRLQARVSKLAEDFAHLRRQTASEIVDVSRYVQQVAGELQARVQQVEDAQLESNATSTARLLDLEARCEERIAQLEELVDHNVHRLDGVEAHCAAGVSVAHELAESESMLRSAARTPALGSAAHEAVVGSPVPLRTLIDGAGETGAGATSGAGSSLSTTAVLRANFSTFSKLQQLSILDGSFPVPPAGTDPVTVEAAKFPRGHQGANCLSVVAGVLSPSSVQRFMDVGDNFARSHGGLWPADAYLAVTSDAQLQLSLLRKSRIFPQVGSEVRAICHLYLQQSGPDLSDGLKTIPPYSCLSTTPSTAEHVLPSLRMYFWRVNAAVSVCNESSKARTNSIGLVAGAVLSGLPRRLANDVAVCLQIHRETTQGSCMVPESVTLAQLEESACSFAAVYFAENDAEGKSALCARRAVSGASGVSVWGHSGGAAGAGASHGYGGFQHGDGGVTRGRGRADFGRRGGGRGGNFGYRGGGAGGGGDQLPSNVCRSFFRDGVCSAQFSPTGCPWAHPRSHKKPEADASGGTAAGGRGGASVGAGGAFRGRGAASAASTGRGGGIAGAASSGYGGAVGSAAGGGGATTGAAGGRETGVCYAFRRGTCKFGDKCQYKHISA